MLYAIRNTDTGKFVRLILQTTGMDIDNRMMTVNHRIDVMSSDGDDSNQGTILATSDVKLALDVAGSDHHEVVQFVEDAVINGKDASP